MDINYEDYIGVPFVKGGRSVEKDGGYDCYGLVMAIKKESGVKLPDFSSPEFHRDIHLKIEDEKTKSDWINKWSSQDGEFLPLSIVESGDILLIKLKKYACHVGICISPDRFIHSWEDTNGATIEKVSFWQKKIVGLYKYNEEKK
jgi:cell wall-associated NlpC family hydrolase